MGKPACQPGPEYGGNAGCAYSPGKISYFIRDAAPISRMDSRSEQLNSQDVKATRSGEFGQRRSIVLMGELMTPCSETSADVANTARRTTVVSVTAHHGAGCRRVLGRAGLVPDMQGRLAPAARASVVRL